MRQKLHLRRRFQKVLEQVLAQPMTNMEPLSLDPIQPSSPPDSDMDLLSQGPVPPIFSPVLNMDSELDSPIRKRPLDTTQTIQFKKNNTGLHQKYQSLDIATLLCPNKNFHPSF
ncbi:hypothetical protein K402DRAFT_394844 [Aulographum hederae CBS 113979]|uniref:Uncharacterized protein n=1 Tax=Aulographum hederae CBS 113979 TaxID=1176131 RepID=A0A6G1GXI8_9PEZI|nr:hypothetical protein K402DRAFT_394844 [Aulographum hederae CBS 113979]